MKLILKHHFDAAHRLTFHEGKCNNLHGHRWEVIVEIDAIRKEHSPMIVDFGDIKKAIDIFDHATILWDNDVNAPLINILCQMDLVVVLLPEEPTAEHIVKKLYEALFKIVIRQVRTLNRLKITLYESPGAGIEYDGGYGLRYGM